MVMGLTVLPLAFLPTSYYQSLLLIVTSNRADCYWREHNRHLTLLALKDFISTCRSVDMRYPT